jgi:hypothetical protein
MEEDVIRCGNDLQYILNIIHRHGPGPDPRFKQLVSELASLTQSMVGVVVSSQITNQALSREFRAESGKALVAAANRMAANQAVAGA